MRQLALDIGLTTGPTLENYVVGSNGQAVQYLRDALQGQARSPVYLWGGPGSGKSHLLKATVAALSEQGARIGWLDASIAWPSAFEDTWDAIALDDTQDYNPAQQAAAFNWFVNASAPASGAARPVFSAGRLPPADLPLREDLRTRLGWGQVFRLEPLDEAQCRAALHQQATGRGVMLADEVLDYMLARFARDMGSLMRLLDQLDEFALRTQRAVTVPLLRAMLREAPESAVNA